MKTSIKSGYTGTNVSVEYGPYGEEKEFPLYDITGETVEEIDEELGYYDEVKTAWSSDGESYMILESRAYPEDKIAVQEDDYNDWVEAMDNEDYSKVIKSSRKSIKSSYEYVWEVGEKRNIPFENVKDVFEGYGYGEEEADDFWNSKMSDVSDTWDFFPELKKMFGWKTVKSSRKSIKSDIDWEAQKHAFDDKKYKIYKTNINGEWEEYPFYGTDNIFVADKFESKGYLVKSSVKEHFLLGKKNFLTDLVYGTNGDDGLYESEGAQEAGEQLINAYSDLFENGDVTFHHIAHIGGEDKDYGTETLDYDSLLNALDGCDSKNGEVIYEDDNGDVVIAVVGSRWTNSKIGEEGTDWEEFRVVDNIESSSRRINMKKAIKSGRFIKSGAGAGYDVTIEGIELDTQNYKVISDEVDEKWNEHTTVVEFPIKPCVVDKWIAEDYYNGVSSDGIYLDGICVMDYGDNDKHVEGGKATLSFTWYPYTGDENNYYRNNNEFTDVEEMISTFAPRDINIKSSFSFGWIHNDLPVEQIHFEDKYHGYEIDSDNGDYRDYNTLSVDLVAPNISENINWFFAHDHELEKIFFDDEEDYENDEIESSHKSKTTILKSAWDMFDKLNEEDDPRDDNGEKLDSDLKKLDYVVQTIENSIRKSGMNAVDISSAIRFTRENGMAGRCKQLRKLASEINEIVKVIGDSASGYEVSM